MGVGGDGYERDLNTGTRGRIPRVDVHGRERIFIVLLPFQMSLILLFSKGNDNAACRKRSRRRTGTNRDKWPRSGIWQNKILSLFLYFLSFSNDSTVMNIYRLRRYRVRRIRRRIDELLAVAILAFDCHF